MATTAISNIINPEVLADQLSAKFPDQLVFGKSNIVKVDADFPLGAPGTQFKIPSWKRIAGFAPMTEGTALVPGNITSFAEYSIVKRAGNALSVNDTAELVSKADPVAEIVSQLGRRAAEYLDAALVACLDSTPNVYDNSTSGAGTLDQNALITGMVGGLGDNYMSLLAGGMIVMHSKVYGDLMKLGLIQNMYQAGIAVIKDGMFSTILGMPVFLSDRVTTATVSGSTQYRTYVVGPESLGLFYQRQVMVEFDRDILGQADIIASTVHFAAHLFGFDEVSNTPVAEQNKSIHAVVINSK